MTFAVTKLTPHSGAEIMIDRKTLLSGTAADKIREALFAAGVVVIRDIALDDDEQLAFAKTLGYVKQERHNSVVRVAPTKADKLQSDYVRGTYSWHMDSMYEKWPPIAVVMTPRVVAPVGGETEFANTVAAFAALPEAEKTYLESLKVIHTMGTFMQKSAENPSEEFRQSWEKFPPREWPMVAPHRSGRPALLISTTCKQVVGLEPKESDALISRLLEWTTQRQFVYQHKWRLGDIVVWDNTGAMHRVLPYDFDCGRRHHRVSIHAPQETDYAAIENADGEDMMNRIRAGSHAAE